MPLSTCMLRMNAFAMVDAVLGRPIVGQVNFVSQKLTAGRRDPVAQNLFCALACWVMRKCTTDGLERDDPPIIYPTIM